MDTATDQPRQDLLKPDLLKPDLLLADLPKPDLPKPDLLTPDLPKPDLLTPDLLKPDIWTCGNNSLEGTEECDGSVPKNRSCKTEGFTHGPISCNNKTCTLNTSACKNAWPLGKDGPLRLGSKYGLKKKVLTTGAVMDYSELIIDADGVLEVQQGKGWVIIGVNGDVKIHGQIVTRMLTKSGLIKATVPVAGKGLEVSQRRSAETGRDGRQGPAHRRGGRRRGWWQRGQGEHPLHRGGGAGGNPGQSGPRLRRQGRCGGTGPVLPRRRRRGGSNGKPGVYDPGTWIEK